MSASFYDLLKYAKTGIASPSMTYYDKLRASTLMGGVVKTLTGQPPLSFKADGTPLTAWSIIANMMQTGTPTSSAPITPEETGDKTANLYNISAHDTTNGYVNNAQLNSDGSTATWGSSEISEYIPIVSGKTYTFNGIGSYNLPSYCIYDSSKQLISGHRYNGASKITFTAQENAAYMRFTHIKAATTAMCVEGTEIPAEFEPYGYKIQIANAGQTYTVYLTEPLRKIGDYADTMDSSGTVTRKVYRFKVTQASSVANYSNGFTVDAPKGAAIQTIMSNIAVSTDSLPAYTDRGGKVFLNSSKIYIGFGATPDFPVAQPQHNPTTQEIKVFNEFVSTHDVYVWFVLATPTTETYTAPTIQTSKGSNTLTVETDLQPSEMTITYKG